MCRKFIYGPGSIIGTTDFFLQRPRSFSATAVQPTRVLVLSRSRYNDLAAHASHVRSGPWHALQYHLGI